MADVTFPIPERIICESRAQRISKRMNSQDLNQEFLTLKDSAYRYAASLLHDRAEAEDLVQDLYERLWRRRLFIRQSGFRQLVMTSTRNMAIDRLRHRQRIGYTLPLESADSPAEPPADTPTAEELSRHIGRIIASLPEREREVVHLREVEGMSFDEIAALTGTTPTAARMAASRGKAKLREELNKILDYGA